MFAPASADGQWQISVYLKPDNDCLTFVRIVAEAQSDKPWRRRTRWRAATRALSST